MTKQRSSELTRELFGMVFYFLADPEPIREQLIQLLLELDRQLSTEFTRFSPDGERIRPLRVSARDYMTRQLSRHDFGGSFFFEVWNGTEDAVHSARLLLMARKHEAAFPIQLPSFLYVELEPRADAELTWSLFQRIWQEGFFHLGLGNRIVAHHLERLPSSGAQAARQVRSAPAMLKCQDALLNPDYRRKIAYGTQIVEGPNEFMAFGPALARQVPVAETLEAASLDGGQFVYIPGEDSCSFRARSSAELQRLAQRLQQFHCNFDKPTKYWKPEEWAKWRGSVLRGELGLAR